ncbi:MAG: hypothetical protein C0483_02910 [Pirellula sp.]|nr:hypothetical protein [Pirellula sp.]
MHALVLSAGFGTRLGTLTQLTPKPMLGLHGRPLLEYIVRHLGWCGYRNLGINLHFLPEVIRNHFGSGSQFGATIQYSPEPELLGTAGGVKNMASLLPADQPFLIHYGDILTDMDFRPMLARHREQNALVTMLVHERPGSNSVVCLTDDGRVDRFLERPTEAERQGITSSWVNSGIWICEPELLSYIPQAAVCDLARDILPKLVPEGRVYAYPLEGYRCAIDSEQRLAAARDAVSTGKCRLRWNREALPLAAAG